jgi:hypothetical protein
MLPNDLSLQHAHQMNGIDVTQLPGFNTAVMTLSNITADMDMVIGAAYIVCRIPCRIVTQQICISYSAAILVLTSMHQTTAQFEVSWHYTNFLPM